MLANKIFLPLFVFFFVYILFLSAKFYNISNDIPQKAQVLGLTIKQLVLNLSPTPTPASVNIIIPSISPTQTPKAAKKSYSIAIIGDSMVDTMGEDLEYLQGDLRKMYPGVEFRMYNYGIGGQNVIEGLGRFDSPFTNRNRNFPPIAQLHPDILIVGSFGYNTLTPFDVNTYWTTLTQLVKKAQTASAHVYMLAEIAPLKNGFGKGPHGVNWDDVGANNQATNITKQLDSAVALSDALHVPLIDAYKASQINGKFGDPKYVGSNDGIHPSVAGHVFMAKLISESLQL